MFTCPVFPKEHVNNLSQFCSDCIFHPWKFHSRGQDQVLPVWICVFFLTASQQCPFFVDSIFSLIKKITAEVYIKSCTEVFVSQIHQNNMFKTNLQVYQLYFCFLIFCDILFQNNLTLFFAFFWENLGRIRAVSEPYQSRIRSGPYQSRIRAVSGPYQGKN